MKRENTINNANTVFDTDTDTDIDNDTGTDSDAVADADTGADTDADADADSDFHIDSHIYTKQLLDEVFVISRIIKVEVIKSYQPQDNIYLDFDYSGYHKNWI